MEILKTLRTPALLSNYKNLLPEHFTLQTHQNLKNSSKKNVSVIVHVKSVWIKKTDYFF